jgi:flagellar motor switch protein FliG
VEESGKIIIKKPPAAGKDIGLLLCLHDMAIQKTLRKLDALTLMYALKNAPEAVRDKVFRNMAPRAAEIFKEDLGYVGKVPLSKVRAAQNQIAAIVDTLALNGKIEIIDEKFV